VTDDLPLRDVQRPIWFDSMAFRKPGPLRRLVRAILSFGTGRRATVPGYDERQPPSEGAVLPVRPKRPDPGLLTAADLDLPSDAD
jgi:hypothetical protein